MDPVKQVMHHKKKLPNKFKSMGSITTRITFVKDLYDCTYMDILPIFKIYCHVISHQGRLITCAACATAQGLRFLGPKYSKQWSCIKLMLCLDSNISFQILNLDEIYCLDGMEFEIMKFVQILIKSLY